MSDPASTITLPVDLTNPGQFFACCGLLELADRLWPGAEGWFEIGKRASNFQVSAASSGASLRELLLNARLLEFEVGNDDATESDDGDEEGVKPLFEPIVITSTVLLQLDWWSDKSIKPWAGSMKERMIFRAMLRAIDPAHPDPLNDQKPVFDPLVLAEPGRRSEKPKKREPFYFDCRRGSNAHPLDSGFSPDTHMLVSNCFPTVEAMCFIGLQRARPAPIDVPNRSRYTVWTKRLPANVIAPVVCGLIPAPGSLTFVFDNFFRTAQKKHKSYSRAKRERNQNV
jgi:CRISPR-associated protein Csb3